jgi:hypothetical protein
MANNKYLRDAIRDVVEGKLRLIDFMDAGAEACDEIEAFYELKGSINVNTYTYIQKVRKARKVFEVGYRRLRKIYYNV